MPPISPWQRPGRADRHGYGVQSFDSTSMEPWLAITNAARIRDAPVVLRASSNVRESCEEGAFDPRVAAT